jgi:NifB/MoaA-like Fe-S oxidoreductase
MWFSIWHFSKREENTLKINEVHIKDVLPGSIAEELEIEKGDKLMTINGASVLDIIEYKYLITDEFLELEIKKPNGDIWDLEGGLSKKLEGAELDGKELTRTEAIIRSMTRKERRDHTIINGSRRKRIATGSGCKVQDVNRLLKQYVEARKMMKRLQDMQRSGKKLSGFRLPFMK